MKTEEFYKKIQEKIDQTNFESDWNKNEIWQRIEQKQTKHKKPFVWLQTVAASVVLLGGLGMYFYNQETDITPNNQVVNNLNPIISTQPTLNPTTKSTQLMANSGNHKNNVVKVMATSKKETTQQLETTPNKENVVTVNEAQNNISPSETASNTAQQTPANDNYRFVPYQGFVEKQVIPQRRERVAILEIPDDEEDYNQAPRKEKKNGLVARLSRKVGKKETEPAEELPSINNKPNKVWAFVKESFKNETMATDSTNK